MPSPGPAAQNSAAHNGVAAASSAPPAAAAGTPHASPASSIPLMQQPPIGLNPSAATPQPLPINQMQLQMQMQMQQLQQQQQQIPSQQQQQYLMLQQHALLLQQQQQQQQQQTRIQNHQQDLTPQQRQIQMAFLQAQQFKHFGHPGTVGQPAQLDGSTAPNQQQLQQQLQQLQQLQQQQQRQQTQRQPSQQQQLQLQLSQQSNTFANPQVTSPAPVPSSTPASTLTAMQTSMADSIAASRAMAIPAQHLKQMAHQTKQQPQQRPQQIQSNKPNLYETAVTVPQVNHTVIESVLEVNKHLIRILVEYQNNGWLSEPEHKIYQQRLHSNLSYLATLADSVLMHARTAGTAPTMPTAPVDVLPVVYPPRLAYLQNSQGTPSSLKSTTAAAGAGPNSSVAGSSNPVVAASGRSDAPSSPAVHNQHHQPPTSVKQEPQHNKRKPTRRLSSSSAVNSPSSTDPASKTASTAATAQERQHRAPPPKDPDEILETIPPTVMVLDPNPATIRQDPNKYIPVPPFVGGPPPSVRPSNVPSSTNASGTTEAPAPISALASPPPITSTTTTSAISKSITTTEEAAITLPGLTLIDPSISREIMKHRLNSFGDGRVAVRTGLPVSHQGYISAAAPGANGSVSTPTVMLGSEIDTFSSSAIQPIESPAPITPNVSALTASADSATTPASVAIEQASAHARSGSNAGRTPTATTPKTPLLTNAVNVDATAGTDPEKKPKSVLTNASLVSSPDAFNKPMMNTGFILPSNTPISMPKTDHARSSFPTILGTTNSTVTPQKRASEDAAPAPETQLDDDEDDEDYVPEQDPDVGDDDEEDEEDDDDDDEDDDAGGAHDLADPDHAATHHVKTDSEFVQNSAIPSSSPPPPPSLQHLPSSQQPQETGTTLEEFFSDLGADQDWTLGDS